MLYNLTLLFLKNLAFIIQTKSDGYFLQSNLGSEVKAVKFKSNATSFTTKKVYNDPDIVIIQESTKKTVLTYSENSQSLISWKYTGGKEQQFRIVLDANGFYQIVQGKNKFLNYDPNSKTFWGGPFRRGSNQGYILLTDDGKREYPKHRPSGDFKKQEMRDDYLNINCPLAKLFD